MKRFFFVLCVLSASCLYAESCCAPPMYESNPALKQGDEVLEPLPLGCKVPAAYNYPGNIQVNDCGDVYFTGSYLFWQIQEEGLNIATTAYVFNDLVGFIEPSITDGFAIFQKTGYTQGFKVGFGTDMTADDWAFDIEGTRICQTTHTRSKPAPISSEGTGVYKFSGWFYESEVTEDVVALQFSSKWEFELDWIDISLKRAYYQGKRVVVAPYTGLRASRIWQKFNITALNAYQAYNDTNPVTDNSRNYSHSWGIGPRALIDTHWLLGAGFRIQGNFGGSLLFTKFTKVFHKESGTGSPVEFSLRDYMCLRPMAEANLGLGWGTYLNYSRRHLDISVTYDFNYLWGQNMVQYIAGLNSSGNISQAGDLFLYGLTVKGRFDF